MLLLQPVVWVDTDLDYAFLVRRAFLNAAVENPIVCLTSGELAMSYLTGYGPAADPTPLLIVIGTPLPKMSRMELLAKIRERPRLASIPVAFLEPEGVDNAVLNQLGVAAILKRSIVKEAIVRLVSYVATTWIKKS